MSKEQVATPGKQRYSDPQKDGRDIHRLRGKVASLKRLLKAARPGLAVYARQVNDPFWTRLLADVDHALGNSPAFPPDNRSA